MPFHGTPALKRARARLNDHKRAHKCDHCWCPRAAQLQARHTAALDAALTTTKRKGKR